MHVVVLLLCDGILGQQFLEATVLAQGILHLCAGFLYAGLRHLYVAFGGLDAAARGLAALFGAGQVGLGLCQTEAELSRFDDGQRVAFLYRLELLEPNLADEALHAGVLRGDVLADTGIVGELHVAEMGELQEYDGGSHEQEAHDDGVVNQCCKSMLFHNLSYKVPVMYLRL